GFFLFFFASIHIYVITTQAANIGPFESADRFVTGWMWPIYLLLIFMAEIHAAVGVYRLAMKWGTFDGANPQANRKRLKLVKNLLTAFFITLGLLTFAAYMKIGIEHRDHAGERYVPGISSQQ
ncbi:MAG: succinate dehydrogenase/fumarate reductase cytochrome b subunit, partial [Deltaproteobacteria bacterium]|nr:succinate dehydrogenase/fumarate reductase cytochrome b subunit [Deltaproteobacteria bacterium]